MELERICTALPYLALLLLRVYCVLCCWRQQLRCVTADQSALLVNAKGDYMQL